MMNRGNELRERTGHNDIMAMAAIGEMGVRRGGGPFRLARTAFVLRQLKRPDEVFLLRRTYGSGFHLLGLYCPRERRMAYLRQRRISRTRTSELIERDEHEGSPTGQDLRETFHLADAFFEVEPRGDAFARQVRRFLELLFGLQIHGPTIDEFGMFQAYGNALRSGQLGRQVGAAILAPTGDLVAVGTNEVPRFGGGVYWEGDARDARDHKRGIDSSDAAREQIVTEISAALEPRWSQMEQRQREELLSSNRERIKATTVWGLTEFGRAVHAESEALSSAARLGVSVRCARLFCTTFPCHVCAKHIVSAGITEVVYIEPYAKSRASSLFDDSISVETRRNGRATFRPFVGIGPRRYVEFFSMRASDGTLVNRKDSVGRPISGEFNPRLVFPYQSALDREKIAARELRVLTSKGVKR